MHLPDGPQLDLSTQVAKVKAKTRPWKAIIALILAICAAAASGWAHNHVLRGFLSDKDIPYQILAIGLAAVFCALASAATLDLASKAREVLEPSAGPSHAAIVRYALLLIGAVTTLIITLGLLGIPIEQLVLGGALTSVFVGIAARQSLSKVFAGTCLMRPRPLASPRPPRRRRWPPASSPTFGYPTASPATASPAGASPPTAIPRSRPAPRNPARPARRRNRPALSPPLALRASCCYPECGWVESAVAATCMRAGTGSERWNMRPFGDERWRRDRLHHGSSVLDLLTGTLW